jgi:hypothetical protein
MSTKNQETAKRINEVEIGEEVDLAAPHKPESVFLKRGRRRRLDLRTLAGTARESAKIYRQFAQKEITAGEAEIRSRMLRRHSEILTSLEQQAQLAAIREQLEALRTTQSFPTFDARQLNGLIDEVPK